MWSYPTEKVANNFTLLAMAQSSVERPLCKLGLLRGLVVEDAASNSVDLVRGRLVFLIPEVVGSAEPRSIERMKMKMGVCQRCIMPDSYPSVTIDNGVCSLCRIHDRSPRLTRSILGKDKLLGILTSKATDKYHCIVPLSGGKDSSYALFFVVRELGLMPLAVSVDSGFLTDSARRSIDKVCEKLSVDLVVHKSRFRQKLAKEALNIWKYRGKYFSVCQSCETSNRSIAINEATKRGIPFIVWGASDFEDDVSTFLSPDSLTFRQRFAQRVEATKTDPHEIVRGTLRDMGLGAILSTSKLPIPLANRFKALLHMFVYLYYSVRNNLDVDVPEGWRRYLPFVQTSFEGRDVETIYLFDYIPYDPSTQIETIKREVGWEASIGKETRMDCKLHSIVSYYLFKETGITPDGFTFSVLIRYGMMNRDEAIEKEEMIRRSLTRDCEELLAELGVNSEGIIP